jgi:hypothetical protein
MPRAIGFLTKWLPTSQRNHQAVCAIAIYQRGRKTQILIEFPLLLLLFAFSMNIASLEVRVNPLRTQTVWSPRPM